MYSVNPNIETALESDGRTFRAYLEVADDEGNIIVLEDIYKIEVKGMSTESSETVQIGTAIATQISVTMEKPSVNLTGKEIKLYIGVLTEDETVEYVPMGIFIPEKPTVSNNTITFEAFDRMGSALAKDYVSELNYPCDVFDILSEIEMLAGVTVSEKPTGLTVNKRVDSEDETTVVYANPFDGYTYAQALGMIAGYYGKFATTNREGKVVFRGYDNDTEYVVSKDSSYSDISEQEQEFTVGYLQCTVHKDTVLRSGEGATGISFSCMLMTQERLDELYEELQGLTYIPTTVSFKGDFRLDLGDVVHVERLDGTTVKLPIMNLTHTYDGGLKTQIGSYGSTEESDGYVAPTEKAISRLYQQLAVVENMIVNKTLTVGQIVSSNLLNNSLTLTGGNHKVVIDE